MIIHSPIISGSLTFADGATFDLPDNGVYSGSFSGSIQIDEVQSHLIPDTAFEYDLGSATNPFRDLYISTGSLKGMGPGGTVKFKLGAKDTGGLKVTDANDEPIEIEAKEITLKDTSGNGNNIKLKVQNGALKSTKISNDDVEDETEEAQTLQSNISGSLIVTGSTSLENTTIDGTIDATGLASLDGGLSISNAFSVATSTGNVSTTGTLGAGNTTITGTVGTTGLASLDGGVNVDDNFTVDASGNTVVGGTLDSTGLASLDGGIDVDGAFTVADSTGNVSTSGTLSAGNTNVATLDASGLASLDGGVNVDDNFTVDASGNTAVGGTLDSTGLASLDGGIDVDGAFTVADGTGNVSTSGTITVPEGNLTIGSTSVDATASELNLLDGSTAGTVVNSKGVVYGSGGEVNATKLQVGGVDITASPAELNLLDDVSGLVKADFTKLAATDASAAELNILGGATVSTAELNFVDGVTSNIQTQFGNIGLSLATNTLTLTKPDETTDTVDLSAYLDEDARAIASGALNGVTGIVTFTRDDASTFTLDLSDLLDDTNLVTSVNGRNGVVTTSLADYSITATSAELNFTDGVTSNIQTQLNAITGTDIDITLTGAVTGTGTITNLGDVSITTTATSDPTLTLAGDATGTATFTNLGNATLTVAITDDSHNHIIGNVDGLQTALDAKLGLTSISATDAGGDGSFSYNNSTGVFTYTGPSATDVRAHFSGGTGVGISSGVISIGQAVATNSNVTFASVSATGDIVAYASSDERLKDNIKHIENPLEKVQKLNGVTWDWNDNADELQKSLPNVGVIAQEVEQVLPQLVKDRENGYKGVDYAKLTGLLIEAIKDQQKQINELISKLG